MKFLFTIVPSLSHLHAVVPIARELARSGHEVAFATARSFGAAVESAGFACFDAGVDWVAEESGHSFRPSEFGERCAPPMVADLLGLAGRFTPDLIVSDLLELGGWIAAEKIGIPHAVIGLSGGVAMSSEWQRKAFGETLNALRSRHGLEIDPGLEGLYRYLRIDLIPPGFRPAAVEPGPYTHDVRPVSSDGVASPAARSWIHELPFTRSVLVTLGTVFNRDREAFQVCLSALAGEQVNVIVAVGGTQDPQLFGPQPPHVRIERYVPFSLIADRVDALVAHGGYLTVMTFLNAGVPMVLVPLAADHPLNAMRLAKMGVAVTIRRPDLSADALRRATRAVLDDPPYRAAAQRIRTEMATQPGPDHAAALLEQLARERRPIPRMMVAIER